MGSESRQTEQKVLCRLVPWLNRQFDDCLLWQGRPEDKSYVSKCAPVRGLRSQLDAELMGGRCNVAIEHTTIEAYPRQRAISASLAKLKGRVRLLKGLVPRGNSISLGFAVDCVRGIKRSAVDEQAMPLENKLKEYLSRIPTAPKRHERIRGHLLEEPLEWCFGPLKVTLSRTWLAEKSHMRCSVSLGQPDWDHGLLTCLSKALDSKVGGKSETCRAYKAEGWLVLLVLELTDWQISTIELAAHAFTQLAPSYNLSDIDGIVLLQAIDSEDETPECCWAYLRGQIRTAQQQDSEVRECLGITPDS